MNESVAILAQDILSQSILIYCIDVDSHDHELKLAFEEILNAEQANAQAVEMNIASIISKTFNVKELQILAKEFELKRPGINWGKDGTPKMTKKDIISALLEKSRVPWLAEKEVLQKNDDDDIGEPAAYAQRTREELSQDFTLPDLIYLAEREGIKKPGVGWGKQGTPQKKSSEIIDALISSWEKKDNEDDADHIVGTIHTGSWLNFYVEEGPQAPTEFMPRERYRKHLRGMSPHLISEDQHIFHIIASVHGGADHPDNYLAPLGSSFMSLGEKMDPFICFIAGKEKTLQAVASSMKAEALYKEDPTRYRTVIDKRQRDRPVFFSECHSCPEKARCLTGEELWAQGRIAWAHMRESWFRHMKQSTSLANPSLKLSLVVHLHLVSEAAGQCVSCRSVTGEELFSSDLQSGDLMTLTKDRLAVAKQCGVDSRSVVFVFEGNLLRKRGNVPVADVLDEAASCKARDDVESPPTARSRGSSNLGSPSKLYIGPRGGLPKDKKKLLQIADELHGLKVDMV